MLDKRHGDPPTPEIRVDAKKRQQRLAEQPLRRIAGIADDAARDHGDAAASSVDFRPTIAPHLVKATNGRKIGLGGDPDFHGASPGLR